MKNNLQEYKNFFNNYKFDCAKLDKTEQGVFYKDICLESPDGAKIFEGDDFINIGYNSKNSISKVLSNLYHINFVFRGKKVASIEGVLQGIKYQNIKLQNEILSYYGLDAYHTRACDNYNSWRKSQTLYWQGKPIKRDSIEYQDFLCELYYSASKNPIYRMALLTTQNKYLLHHIGCEDMAETVLTRQEYEKLINSLRDFVMKNK